MDNFADHFKQSLRERADNIINDAAAENSKYKEIVKEYLKLEDELTKLLPEDKFKLFDDYRDVLLQRESFLIEIVYLQAFADGAEMKKLFL